METKKENLAIDILTETVKDLSETQPNLQFALDHIKNTLQNIIDFHKHKFPNDNTQTTLIDPMIEALKDNTIVVTYRGQEINQDVIGVIGDLTLNTDSTSFNEN